MPLPATRAKVPEGLAYLTQVDKLLVHQLVKVLERKYSGSALFIKQ